MSGFDGENEPRAAARGSFVVPRPVRARHDCRVTTAGLLLHSASALVTLAGPSRARRGREMEEIGTIPDGAVACADGRIVAVGTTADVRASLAGDATLAGYEWSEIDCSAACVTPGLIDPHTHVPFAGSRPGELAMRQRGATYLELLQAGGGILSTVAATRAASESDLVARGQGWLAAMLAQGVTTIEAKSGYGLDLETELRQLRALRVLSDEGPVEILPTLLAAHAVPPEFAGHTDAYIDSIAVPLAAEAARLGLARFVDAFCEHGVFDPDQSRRALEAGMAAGLVPRLHADELQPSGGARLAAEIGALSADHLGAIDDEGVRALSAGAAANGTPVATLLPITSLYLSCPEAPARRLIDEGVPVAIGTDFNPGTSPSPSLPLAMALARIRLRLTPAETLTAVTMNAAASLGEADRLGSLEVGKQADLVVWDVRRHEEIGYWLAAPLARHVIKRGQVAYHRPER